MNDQTKIDLEKKLMDKSLLTLEEIFQIQMLKISTESPIELMKRVDWERSSNQHCHTSYNIQYNGKNILKWGDRVIN